MLHRSGGVIEPNWLWRDIPGIVLCALIACAATWMALLAGSAVIWGLILGLVLAAIWSPPALFQTGISFAARQVMRIGVALLGFQISLATLQILDVADVAALAINVAIVLAIGWFRPDARNHKGVVTGRRRFRRHLRRLGRRRGCLCRHAQ
ncbi:MULTISPECIES: putative sulfate exporter family transporter [unclassified Bradyrhizobium]|uniref:putative sulfate exporter family transporter n=1 Tax=unclassified Bradyrhizobium TaxID=2631580 RepID=UPI002FEFFC22